MLHVNDLTYRIQGRTLLDGASVHVPPGHKVALVGRNGTGKSTLFRLIAGDIAADGGEVRIQNRARVGSVAQEAPGGPESLLDTVLAADKERAALLAEAETATDPTRIADIHTRLADIRAHEAPARAARILSGLGFDEAAQGRPCSDYSGGWRMRVALAAALFAEPDLLMLDEPTNHLDLEATLWLTGYLKSWPGTLLMISHDRELLNDVPDTIVHLEGATLTRYAGNYDAFERVRREKMDQQAKLHQRQVAERERIQSFVDRFRAKATKARQAQSRLKMLERMEPIAAVVEEPGLTLAFPDPEGLAPPLLALDEVDVGYGDTVVLKDLGLRLDADDRIGLLGANGNGKSTLIKLLGGRLDALGGEVTRSKKLRVGYFAQHQADELNAQGTAYTHMAEKMGDAKEPAVRAHLGRFGFGADKADTKVANLSGGEKAKLLLALMAYDAPHIMLLDEPTNHLDVDAREALVHALNAYAGAVVLVSHDPHLLGLVCDRFWRVANGTCAAFDGDMEAYAQLLAAERRDARGDAPKEAHAASKKDQRRERAEARQQTAALRKAAKAAEKDVDRYSAQVAALEEKMADPKLYDGPADKVTALQKDLAQARDALEQAEEAWMAAQEDLETAEA